VIPDQIRAELERNLSAKDLKRFYALLYQCGVEVDFGKVPAAFINEFETKGLKEGDAEIGAFCEWRGIDLLISDNRHFLRTLSSFNQNFQIMSPITFWKTFCISQ
jgi:hypothetical protein